MREIVLFKGAGMWWCSGRVFWYFVWDVDVDLHEARLPSNGQQRLRGLSLMGLRGVALPTAKLCASTECLSLSLGHVLWVEGKQVQLFGDARKYCTLTVKASSFLFLFARRLLILDL